MTQMWGIIIFKHIFERTVKLGYKEHSAVMNKNLVWNDQFTSQNSLVITNPGYNKPRL
jgi:hypothetical protein